MENNRMSPERRTIEEKPAETDTGKIVRRHLENEHDEITDEDIRNVRIAVSENEPITTGAEAKARFINEDLKDEDSDENEVGGAPDPKDKPVTPWDMLDK